MRLAILGILGVLVIATMPAADAAVHGVWWDATGTAVNASGQVFLIRIHWSGGNFFACPPTYTVTLTSPSGVTSSVKFAGYQNQLSFPTQGFIQEGFTDAGASTDPAVQFSYTGVQWATIGFMPHLLTQAITGGYQGLTFAAVTAQPWDFTCVP